MVSCFILEFLYIISTAMNFDSQTNDSKFESPIEEILLKEIGRCISEGTEIILQRDLETPNGNYRPDALLLRGNEVMAIECDGKDFHTGHENELYDLWRDAFLLFHNQVDFIYRFRGREIHYFLSDVIYLLAKEQPQFFDSGKIKGLSTNFTQYFHESNDEKYRNQVLIEFKDPEEEGHSASQRRKGFYYSYRDKKEWFPDFGPEALLLGELFPGKSAKQLLEQSKNYRLLGDALFTEVERQKPGALLKYIHFFKDYFHYVGAKGELIKKYKQIAGYPVERTIRSEVAEKRTYGERNLQIWNEVVRTIIPLSTLPQSLTWTDRNAIISAIKLMRGYDNNVVVFFPKEGDSHLFDVKEGFETDFIELHSGSFVHIGRPQSLEYIQVPGWSEAGFFRLNFETIPLVPVEPDDDTPLPIEEKNYQLLLEFRPGKYTSEQSENKYYERLVKRYIKGHIVFFRNCTDDHPIFALI